MTLASSGRIARELARQMVTNWWHSNRPKHYADLELETRRKKPPELALLRAFYARLTAARTGHGDFAAYHRHTLLRVREGRINRSPCPVSESTDNMAAEKRKAMGAGSGNNARIMWMEIVQ